VARSMNLRRAGGATARVIARANGSRPGPSPSALSRAGCPRAPRKEQRPVETRFQRPATSQQQQGPAGRQGFAARNPRGRRLPPPVAPGGGQGGMGGLCGYAPSRRCAAHIPGTQAARDGRGRLACAHSEGDSIQMMVASPPDGTGKSAAMAIATATRPISNAAPA
jgi:hypothetical protein